MNTTILQHLFNNSQERQRRRVTAWGAKDADFDELLKLLDYEQLCMLRNRAGQVAKNYEMFQDKWWAGA